MAIPIDPQLEHDLPRGMARVEFEIPSEHIADLYDVLRACGLSPSSMEIQKRILNNGAPADPFDTDSEWGI